MDDLLREVPGEGPHDAEVVIIGEAGGEEESRQHRPFVGPTGKLLEELLAGVGLHRAQCRIDNVVQRHPKKNKLESIPKDEMERWKVDFHERLDALRPRLVIALGGLSLTAFFGKRSITAWRGSLLDYQMTSGHRTTVLPMFHPAHTFNDPGVRVTLDRDFQRARDWLDGTIGDPAWQYHIRPTIEEVELYASIVMNLTNDHLMTLDIETPGYLACIGFSYDARESMTIPTTLQYWKDSMHLGRAWRAIRAMCHARVPKVLQHGLYDAYWLRRLARVEIVNWQWDLMCMHHCLHPQQRHSLDYIASMYCDFYRFWKHEAKDVETVGRYAKKIDALYTYNGMDCCNQRFLFDPLYEEMQRRGLVDFYAWHYRRLIPHMLDLMCHGVRVDGDARKRRAAKAIVACVEAEGRLTELVGKRIFAKKSLKRKVITDHLYETLKLPKQKKRKTGKVTTDIYAIMRLTHKYPKKMGELGPLILAHRTHERLAQFLDPKKVDHDGRFRSSYGFDPSTGRFSSSPNPMGTGDDAQNQDRRIRDTFLADEGCVLVRCDLSQAESRVVDMLTLHPALVDRARSRPWERNVHRECAAAIYGLAEADVTERQKYLAKRFKYAGLYGMRGARLSEELMKEGIFLSPEQCQKMIEKAIEDAVREWQRGVRSKILRDRAIGNSWGWVYDFTGLRYDDETYRVGYACQPQSEIGFLMHHWGFLALAEQQRALACRINLHVHDELVVSARPERVYEVMLALRASLERPRRYSAAGPLTIPCEWKIGRTWAGDYEWKEFPTRPVIEAAVASLEVT